MRPGISKYDDSCPFPCPARHLTATPSGAILTRYQRRNPCNASPIIHCLKVWFECQKHQLVALQGTDEVGSLSLSYLGSRGAIRLQFFFLIQIFGVISYPSAEDRCFMIDAAIPSCQLRCLWRSTLTAATSSALLAVTITPTVLADGPGTVSSIEDGGC